VDDETIRWCALATRAACSRMTAQHLQALTDSVDQARRLPARLWDRKATVHAQFFDLLADVITDRPVPAAILGRIVGAMHALMVTVGPGADRLILSSRGRLLDLIRIGDAEAAAAEVEQHLRRLHFMGRLARGSEPGNIAV
jgi:GntR family transcriptional regulator, transcriptional repressor for pyruvate dehydrogenase complex